MPSRAWRISDWRRDRERARRRRFSERVDNEGLPAVVVAVGREGEMEGRIGDDERGGCSDGG